MLKPKSATKSFQWTPNLAYIVGLLTTDGCLSNDRRHIIMRSSDIQLLETFKKCLKINNKIGITQNSNIRSYRVQYGDVQFYNWLLSIGLYPAKTYTLGKIFIPSRYLRDFLRGHLDGDGSIITYQDNYNSYKGKRYLNTRIYIKFISASEKYIHGLHKMIRANYPVIGALIRVKPKENRVGMWIIKFSKYDSIKLFRWLYYKKNLPTLKRKRDVAEKLLSRVVNNKLIR